MSSTRRLRHAIPALAAAIALGGEDAERAVDQGVKEDEAAGRDAEEAGEDAAREAEEALFRFHSASMRRVS